MKEMFLYVYIYITLKFALLLEIPHKIISYILEDMNITEAKI